MLFSEDILYGYRELLTAYQSVIQGLAGGGTILVVAGLDGGGLVENHQDQSDNTANENESECTGIALITGRTEEQASNDGRRGGADSGADAAKIMMLAITRLYLSSPIATLVYHAAVTITMSKGWASRLTTQL